MRMGARDAYRRWGEVGERDNSSLFYRAGQPAGQGNKLVVGIRISAMIEFISWGAKGEEYKEFLEGIHGLAIIAERRDQPTIAFEELKKKRRQEGMSYEVHHNN